MGLRGAASIAALFACAFAVTLAARGGTPGHEVAAGPLPPCGVPPVPAYPAPNAPPAYALWQSNDLDGSWRPPACTGLTGTRFLALVALAGRIEAPDLDALLTRVGAVSSLAGLRYWSIDDQRWEVLITRAEAVDGLDRRAARTDFTAAEVKSGRDLYFIERENRIGADVVYRLRLERRAGDSVVLQIENAAPVRRFLVPLLDQGALSSVYFFEPAPDGGFHFYSLLRVGGPGLLGWFVREGSYLNRAAAFYRHLAGLPADQEPPAQRS